jgi:hypothetical protein
MKKDLKLNKICSFKFNSNIDGILDSVFWQTSEMKKTFQKYSNVICIDATFNLNRSGYAVFIIITIDANFDTRIVAFGLIANDKRSDILESLFNWFNENNSNHTRIKTIITDKNESQINVLRKLYPQSDVFLCLYHVFKTLKLETLKKVSHARLNDLRGKFTLIYEDYIIDNKSILL